MGEFSVVHWIVVLVVVMLLFGRGKVPELMGDVAKGIKSFRRGLKDDDESEEAPRKLAREADHGAPSESRVS